MKKTILKTVISIFYCAFGVCLIWLGVTSFYIFLGAICVFPIVLGISWFIAGATSFKSVFLSKILLKGLLLAIITFVIYMILASLRL